MKRRNADCGKLRRPVKKGKISEGIYSSTILYIKFLLVWSLVLMADYIIQFRFEYLWPFWLLLRSVHDSFKYQGLAFSILFVCIAVTSDVICYLFIPVQWLFFAASTYVWIQYVWHTERGLCLSTASLWIIFVYVEASIRLREVNIRSLPFHLDLCRPFAAHCIGYPVVTLGFGFKSYISYKLRLRKQKDVDKENDFFFELLQQALPVEAQIDKPKVIESTNNLLTSNKEETISNGALHNLEQSDKKRSVNDYEEENAVNEAKSLKSGSIKSNNRMNSSSSSSSSSTITAPSRGKSKSPPSKDNKDEHINRLETEVRQLRGDVQKLRTTDSELRSKLYETQMNEKHFKSDSDQLRQDNESLQTRLHNLVTSKQQDKTTINGLQLKLSELSKQKQSVEAKALQQKSECNSESCKTKKRDLETEIKLVRKDLKCKEDRLKTLEQEVTILQRLKDQQSDSNELLTQINSIRDENKHLLNNLSAETRVKLDLFSVLEKQKREIEVLNTLLRTKEQHVSQLESSLAEVMALIPSATVVTTGSWSVPSNLNPRASDYLPE